jgi:hypothetical protein
MDPARVERAVTARTRAILPVHLFGQRSHAPPNIKRGHHKNDAPDHAANHFFTHPQRDGELIVNEAQPKAVGS